MSYGVFSQYKTDTGEIVAVFKMPINDKLRAANSPEGFALTAGELDHATHYMQGGSPVERPASVAVCDRTEIVADGEDVATISGLPVPCTVEIAGPVSAEIEVSDGLLEFTAATPGDYRITIEAFPVQRYEVIIHAV